MGYFKNAFPLWLCGIGGCQQQVHKVGTGGEALYIQLLDKTNAIVSDLPGVKQFSHYVAHAEVNRSCLLNGHIELRSGISRIRENEDIPFRKEVIGISARPFRARVQETIFENTIYLVVTIDEAELTDAPVEPVIGTGGRSARHVYYAGGNGL
jgi:hypothetical protein